MWFAFLSHLIQFVSWSPSFLSFVASCGKGGRTRWRKMGCEWGRKRWWGEAKQGDQDSIWALSSTPVCSSFFSSSSSSSPPPPPPTSSCLQPPCCHRMLQSGSLFFELEHAKKRRGKKRHSPPKKRRRKGRVYGHKNKCWFNFKLSKVQTVTCSKHWGCCGFLCHTEIVSICCQWICPPSNLQDSWNREKNTQSVQY